MKNKDLSKGEHLCSGSEVFSVRGHEIQQDQLDLVRKLIMFFEQRGETEIVAELSRTEFYVQQPFLIVVVGEFNSGKSALINALLGEELLDMDVTPTTEFITVISSTAADPVSETGADTTALKQIKLNHPRLETLAIVDTPGTNSLIDRHQQLTEKFIPRADLIIFISSCQQPLTASERYFLALINQEWKRKIIFVLNKMDLLEADELKKVLNYTEEHLKELLDRTVRVIPVSARNALKALRSGDQAWSKAGNIDQLENLIFSQLSDCEKWQLKLRTPMLNVYKQLESFSARYRQIETSVNRELEAIKKLENQAQAWSQRIKELAEAYIPAVETPFYRFEQSCNRFLDQKMNIIHFLKMKISGYSLEDDFHREVFDDPRFKEDFDRTIGAAIQFVVVELQRYQHDTLMAIHDLLEKNASVQRQIQSMPDYKRLALQNQIKASDSFQPADMQTEKEAQAIRRSITQAIANFVGMEVLGGSVVAVTLASAALYDVTGILLGAVLAGLGFAILPRKKARLKIEFAQRIREIAGQVRDSLRHHLHQKIELSQRDFRASLTPYISLCQSEQVDIQGVNEQLVLFQNRLKELNGCIESLAEPQ
ncbi:dynamin family protein [bacterium]|nr:dynamin family protein [bacterium]